ncbi:ROK family protein [Alkalicoccus urumqiensis]|uniref:ROK family protein n=1 Tax=Alkalicoccus urumqiensis TaxID=1548213 RepID=A0A2P6MHW4_ALKUR|nr:ROK family protein [Alkalicoccus urumqiensis]PRO65866.1 hypothetical protein C6I21_08195 [Alkalicoccus urumqiensis]
MSGALDTFYRDLAAGIYNLQYIYAPDLILLGGGISLEPRLIEGVRRKLDELLALIPLAKVTPVIDTCNFKQQANLFGAVYAYRRQELFVKKRMTLIYPEALR